MRQIFFKASEQAGTRSNVKLLAKGENMPDIPLPPAPPVTVQLHSAGGECWESTFSSPKKNDGRIFKARE